MLDRRQPVLVPAGTTLTAWALPDVAENAGTPPCQLIWTELPGTPAA